MLLHAIPNITGDLLAGEPKVADTLLWKETALVRPKWQCIYIARCAIHTPDDPHGSAWLLTVFMPR